MSYLNLSSLNPSFYGLKQSSLVSMMMYDALFITRAPIVFLTPEKVPHPFFGVGNTISIYNPVPTISPCMMGERGFCLSKRASLAEGRKAVILRGVFILRRKSREGRAKLGGFYCLKGLSMTIKILEIGVIPDSLIKNSNSAF